MNLHAYPILVFATISSIGQTIQTQHVTPPESFAQVAASGSTANAPGCGDPGQPMCPLQEWMRTKLAQPALDKDGPKLASGLEYLATHRPAGYEGWAEIAREGAEKARAGDITGARVSCRSCHNQFKARYRVELRDRPF